MYLCLVESFGLRRSCTEVQRPTFFVVLCKLGNPTTNATEGDYTHLDNFLRLSSM